MFLTKAYYNEHDPKAAAWLRELIKQGHIAYGDVDERSIEDVSPHELKGYTQCHFFAGIGVWSYALRRAGWPDDRQVWTGSCPCQPFSSAGKAGGFDDERHLWPTFHHLIEQCNPDTVFGEQVASKDGLAWLDLVQADLEGTGYATGAVDLCAAGIGAPHIRQRLWFVAERLDYPSAERLERSWSHRGSDTEERVKTQCGNNSTVSRLAYTECTGSQGRLHRGKDKEWEGIDGHFGCDSTVSRLGIPDSTGSQPRREGSETTRHGSTIDSAGSTSRVDDSNYNEHETNTRRDGEEGSISEVNRKKVYTGVSGGADCSDSGGLADSDSGGRREEQQDTAGVREGVETTQHEAGGSGTGGDLIGVANSVCSGTIRDNSRKSEGVRVGISERGLLHKGRDQKEQFDISCGTSGRLADSSSEGLEIRAVQADSVQGRQRPERFYPSTQGSSATSPTNGIWRDADWLFCRDGKWRPVEPGTSPLAHGAPERVGLLRGYGNAINAEAAQAFIESYLEV